MAPQLAKLAKEHGDKVVVLKVDVSRQGQMAQKAGVRSIPDTRLLYKGKQLTSKVGGMRFQDLVMMVLKNASKLPPIKAAKEIAPRGSAGKPRGSAATPAGEEGKAEKIVPMTDDWLPPGVTRD